MLSTSDGRKLPHDLGWRAQHEAAGRHLEALCYQRTRTDDGSLADDCLIHDDGAHTDQTMRLHGAAMQNDAMPNADKVSQDRGVSVAGHMQHAGVLNVGAVTDPNVVDIAPHHRVEPDAGMVADDDIADYLRAVFDEDPRPNCGNLP